MSNKLFSALLKYWRIRRDMSQLDLALVADVSARHISFLETGRASPSEEMVLRLMKALEVPVRDQNHILGAADFQSRSPEPDFEELDPTLDMAIVRMMQNHGPYPFTVMNAGYDIIRCNDAARTIFSQFVVNPARLKTPVNLFELVFDPELARPFIKNWTQVGQQMIYRLQREALLSSEDGTLRALLARVLAYPDMPRAWRHPDFSLTQAPINSLTLENGALKLGFFMVVTTFLASQQVTLDELRIESYFPIDEETRRACEMLSEKNELQAA
ncbi:helix-turn-helix domain-containing protein [Rhodoferax ferrireducens]|uniref:helix-turn-helix domain-containing protein n=1 Tax=Rhodoferax ferrireducens TaxID=192843 RepID=UPI000E0DBB74|nr:helix-turn-helix transcriptional regulator [Rhodoferax ferrireducens]